MSTLYKAIVTSQGGRNGQIESSDGILNMKVSMPKELGGVGGATNPEQLFAAGYAACFENALIFVAKKENLKLTSTAVTAVVGIGPNATGGFALSVELKVKLPDLDRDAAQKLVDLAHATCPYSNATRGNIPVEITIE